MEHALEREGRVALEALIDFLRDMRMEVLRGTAVIHLGACRSIVRASATLVAALFGRSFVVALGMQDSR